MSKTAEQIKQELSRKGVSVAAWSAANGLNSMTVYELLAGRSKGLRGDAHRAAVLLGMKEGETIDRGQVKDALRRAR